MNRWPKKGQLVCELEILRAKINVEIKNHMVLNTLSDTFSQFKIDYELTKKDYTLTALTNDLQIIENIFMKKNSISLEASMAKGPSSSKPNVKAK